MDFISANSDLFIMIGLVIIVLVFGMILIPFLQRKEYITIENVRISRESLQILKLLFIEAEFKNKDNKEQTILILDTIENILEYIENELQVTNIEKKKEIAYQMIVDTLKDLDVKINENRKLLIKLTIEEVLRLKG